MLIIINVLFTRSRTRFTKVDMGGLRKKPQRLKTTSGYIIRCVYKSGNRTPLFIATDPSFVYFTHTAAVYILASPLTQPPIIYSYTDIGLE